MPDVPYDLDRLRNRLSEIDPEELAAIVRTLVRAASCWVSFEIPRHTCCNTDMPDATCAVCLTHAALTRVRV